MSESLSSRVARFVQTQPKRRSGRARAAVVALREEIQKALADGWSVMAIWRTLHAEGSVQVGYHAFRRYVAELLRTRPDQQRPAAPAFEPAPKRSPRPEPAATPVPNRPRAFVHNARPQLDKIYGSPGDE